MNTLIQDLRYATRMLINKPAFSLVALIVLALGIGANTAIFSVVNGVLLKPTLISEPERLVMVWNKGVEAAGGDRTPLAVADVLDWRAQSHSFESVAAYQNGAFNYTGGQSPERVLGVAVTGNFFSTIGVLAALGRTFFADEENPSKPRVAVISHRFWQRQFGGDPQTIDRAINLNGASYTIVGVMPAAFDYPARDVEIWTALQLAQPARRGPYFLSGVARLNPGVTIEQARGDMNAMKSTVSTDTFSFNVVAINDFIVGDVRLALWALLAVVTLVLLIAAANVANLLLMRAAARGKEISIRVALGASRWRIIQQLLTESLLLAIVGGAMGALFAKVGVALLIKLAPDNLPRLHQVGIDGDVLAWTALVSLAAGVLFGLAPALQSSRINLNEALKEGGRTTESLGKRRWRNLLVVSEMAMAVMLLIGAGLLIKSFWRLQQVDCGIDPTQVLIMQIPLRGTRYAQEPPVRTFNEQILKRVETLPGVKGVALSNGMPPDSNDGSDDYRIVGKQLSPGEHLPVADVIRVSQDYFRVLGIALKRGRLFTETDSRDAPRVAIINEMLAREEFPNEDPVGRRLNRGSEEQPSLSEIIGVVADVKYEGLSIKTRPAIYEPSSQNAIWTMFLSVKSELSDALNLASAVRSEVVSLDPELPVTQVGTLENRISSSIAQPRFRTLLIAIFGAIALVLASVGIYGVMSYSVAQRTHEIGIRVALGAQRSNVMKTVIGQGMVLTLAGVGIGLVGAFTLTHLMASLLFGVSATDAITFSATAVLLSGVALGACFVPARRAMRVDPMVALRYE
jgi:putative ABC transport system permease protein